MRTLLFVYNADAGLWNAVMDSLHKAFAPKTYPCSLCAITYGYTSMQPKWKAFLETELKEHDIVYKFLHKDEFIEIYGAEAPYDYPLPAVFWSVEGEMKLDTVIPAKEMDQLKLDKLIYIIRERVLV